MSKYRGFGSSTRAFVFSVLVLSAGIPQVGLSAEYFSNLVRPTNPAEQIQFLKIEQNPRLQLLEKDQCKVTDYCIKFEGQLTDPNAQIALLTKKGQTVIVKKGQPNRKFRMTVPISGLSSQIRLTGEDSTGKSITEAISFNTPDWAKIAPKTDDQKRSILTPTLSYTSTNYTQVGTQGIEQTALTLNLDYQYFLKPNKLFLGVGTLFTAVPMSSNRPDITARFVAANWRVGYRFSPDAWIIEPMFGTYYETMFVTEDRFGFRDASGPQASLRIGRKINATNTIAAYGRFALLSRGFFPSNTSDNATAGGLMWTWTTRPFQALNLSIDLTKLNYTIENTPITSSSQSFGVGYSFYW